MEFKKVEFTFLPCLCNHQPKIFLCTYKDSARKSLRAECPHCHLYVDVDCLDDSYVSLYDHGVLCATWNDTIRAELFPEVPDA